MTDRFISDEEYAAFEAAILENDVPIVGDDLDYGRWFVCDEEAEPPRRVRRPRADPFEAVKQSLREIVRDELRRDRDLKSFAAASPWMSLTELQEYLGMGNTTIWELRQKRRRAKTDAERDAAFPPDHGQGKQLRFDRREVDAWVKGHGQ